MPALSLRTGQTLVSASYRAVSQLASFPDRMHLACSTNHGMTGESSLSGSCVLLSMWHFIVRMIPHSSIAAFSMSPFDSLSPFTASSVVTSALHICGYAIPERDYCRLCVALQRDFTIAKQVNEFRHPFDRPRLFDSFLQRHTAHDVLMSVFLHRKANY